MNGSIWVVLLAQTSQNTMGRAILHTEGRKPVERHDTGDGRRLT